MTRLISALLVFLLLPVAGHAITTGKQARDRDGLRRSIVRIENSIGELCTGVLVAPDVVLTAAHCLIVPVRYKVVALDRSFKPQSILVTDIRNYGTFVVGEMPQQQTGVDLALVKLETSLQDDFLPLGIAADHRIEPEENLFLAGYGSVSYNNVKSAKVLRVASLISLAVEQPPNGLVIAADPKRRAGTSGAGACRGDSGGPALVMTDQGYAIGGIASWSSKPQNTKVPYPCGGLTAITPVAPHAGWIMRTISRISDSRR